MEKIVDFLTFKTFISPLALIIFYYMGAVVMPLAIWFISRWLMKKITMVEEGYQRGKRMVWSLMSWKYRLLCIGLCLMMFVFMELLWRMMFEFLLAYLQMWEALVHP